VRIVVRNPPSGNERAVVAWDVDATMWDFHRAFYDACREVHVHLPSEPPAGEVTWRWVCDRIGHENAVAVLPKVHTADWMVRYGPLPGAVEATHAVRAAGARVVVMTHRPPDTAPDTQRFLDEAGFHWDELRVGQDCKVTACGALGASVIVDDMPSTLERAVARGIEALTIAWPHNAEIRAAGRVLHAPDYAGLLPQILAAVERAARTSGGGTVTGRAPLAS
jgi:hypothetical protein